MGTMAALYVIPPLAALRGSRPQCILHSPFQSHLKADRRAITQPLSRRRDVRLRVAHITLARRRVLHAEATAGRCFDALARDCDRISCSVKIDYRKGPRGRLQSKVEKVQALVKQPLKTG